LNETVRSLAEKKEVSFIVRTTAVKSPETQRSLDALTEYLKSNIGRVNRDHGESLLNPSPWRSPSAKPLNGTTLSKRAVPLSKFSTTRSPRSSRHF